MLCLLCLLFCFYFPFLLSFASLPAGGQVLDGTSLNTLSAVLNLRGNFESNMWRKSLIVNLAALVGKFGHSGRVDVRRVCERWAIETQHQ